MLKSAIIGCGNIGKGHAPAYKGCREIELAAVVDVIRDRAASLGKEHGVPAYTKLKDVLKRPDIDFIDVCVPSGLHGNIAIAAAKAGKHCISEKPLDVTPQRCDEIIAAFQKSGTVLGGIYQHRYHDDVRKLKAALDEGRLGRVTLATCSTPWWRTQEYYDSGDWRGTWKLDGGGALLSHERIEVEDVAVAVCEFESGALGVIEGTTAAHPGSGVQHKVLGDAGMAYLVGDKITLWKLRDEAGREAATPAAPADSKAEVGAAADPKVLSDNLFTRNLDDIARAARTGGRPCVTGAEAKKAVEVICAIYKSARTGRQVRLPLKEFQA